MGSSARDRHGRGLRGTLAPPHVPLARSRADRFDAAVLDAIDHLPARFREDVDRLEVAVEDVPPLDDWGRDWVPLARTFPAEGALPPRIVVYRRPLETRVKGQADLRALVHDVVVEEVAAALGLAPEELDPGYDPPED